MIKILSFVIASMLSLSAQAAVINSAVYLSPKNVSEGKTIVLRNSILSTQALSGVKVVLEVHKVSAANVIEDDVIFSSTYTGQNFSANERKVYSVNYTIPATVSAGTYAYVIKAMNAAGNVTYLHAKGLQPIFLFYVTGEAAATPTPTPVATPVATPVSTPGPTPTPAASAGEYLRGINVMDLGISGHVIPGVYGTHYTKPSAAAIKALRDRGLDVIRIPFLWERVQSTYNGPLNPTYLGYIMQVLRDSNAVGMKVILDMHNYGRFQLLNGTLTTFGSSNGPSKENYADVWKKLTQAIKVDANAYNAVYAYDIMNEPYNLPTVNGLSPQKLWEAYSQSAVSGIRSVGEKKMIMVEGYSYSSATLWPQLHPVPWIQDPENNIMYHAHSYMDNNAGGVFTASFAQETAFAKSQGYASVAARGIARVKKFTDWVAKHKVRGFLGEYGWPNAHMKGGADAAAWNATGEELLDFLDSVKMGATMWATGSWLSPTGNVLNAYVLPRDGKQQFEPLSQTQILERHPGK